MYDLLTINLDLRFIAPFKEGVAVDFEEVVAEPGATRPEESSRQRFASPIGSFDPYDNAEYVFRKDGLCSPNVSIATQNNLRINLLHSVENVGFMFDV